LGVAEHLGSAE